MHFTDPKFTHSDNRMWNKAYKHIKNTKIQNMQYKVL